MMMIPLFELISDCNKFIQFRKWYHHHHHHHSFCALYRYQTKANFVRCCVKIGQNHHSPEMDMIGVILSAKEVVRHHVTKKYTTIGDYSFKVVSSSHLGEG
jgi:hypothetical protein